MKNFLGFKCRIKKKFRLRGFRKIFFILIFKLDLFYKANVFNRVNDYLTEEF